MQLRGTNPERLITTTLFNSKTPTQCLSGEYAFYRLRSHHKPRGKGCLLSGVKKILGVKILNISENLSLLFSKTLKRRAVMTKTHIRQADLNFKEVFAATD